MEEFVGLSLLFLFSGFSKLFFLFKQLLSFGRCRENQLGRSFKQYSDCWYVNSHFFEMFCILNIFDIVIAGSGSRCLWMQCRLNLDLILTKSQLATDTPCCSQTQAKFIHSVPTITVRFDSKQSILFFDAHLMNFFISFRPIGTKPWQAVHTTSYRI